MTDALPPRAESADEGIPVEIVPDDRLAFEVAATFPKSGLPDVVVSPPPAPSTSIVWLSSLVISSAVHVSLILALLFVSFRNSSVEFALRQGGIVLQVSQPQSAAASDARWHVHAPFVPSDHQHESETEVRIHRHEVNAPTPEARPAEHPRRDVALPELAVSPSGEVQLASPPEQPSTQLPTRSESQSSIPEVTAETAVNPTRAPAPMPQVQISSPELPANESSTAGAAVDVLPESLPFNPEPPYPPEAFARRQQGRVLLEVVVDENGRVKSLRVATTSGVPALDRSALDTVRAWRFKPAQRGGVAVETAVAVPIRFRIRE